MGVFGVWCGKCAKYLAFGTFATLAVDDLSQRCVFSTKKKKKKKKPTMSFKQFFFLLKYNFPMQIFT